MNPRTLLSGASTSRLFTSTSLSSSTIFKTIFRPKSTPLIPKSCQTQNQSKRTILTFPHPTLENPETGSTNLIIKTINTNTNRNNKSSSSDIPSLLHLYEILKRVEKKLKVEIFDFSIMKDSDSLSPLSTIYLTTLKPIHLRDINKSGDGLGDESVRMEIKIPKYITQSHKSNFLGGPSLADVQSVLNNNNGGQDAHAQKVDQQGDEQEIIQIKIEVQRNTFDSHSTYSSKRKMKNREQNQNQNQKRQRYPSNGIEASQIVQSLKSFQGGFYGGFEGLAEKFEHLIIAPQDQSSPNQGEKANVDLGDSSKLGVNLDHPPRRK